eukprot:gnl/Dysnectes_brevis/159_a186_6251.p1 GENE.gnl/Dysnectes_brevis/159_a186_6251~~gnl/Dysnectes_brevis/159_a186_6251.p1  ORF type:complete len:343 (+),score=117.70 gnl/Dysnectes_brevis/159_a186_6251:39-1031(+)
MTDNSAIRRQLEFYFSDANIVRDDWLKTLIRGSEDGMVPLATILKFPRLIEMGATKEVIQHIFEETESKIISFSADFTTLKRVNPIPDQSFDPIPLSLYMKGFPRNTTIDSVIRILGSPEPALVRLRYGTLKGGARIFKGSALVQYHTKEEADSVWERFGKTVGLEAEKLKLAEHKYSQFDEAGTFIGAPEEEIEDAAIVTRLSVRPQAEWQAERPSRDKKKKRAVPVHKPGVLVHVTGLVADSSREDLRDALSKYDVKYVKYSRGKADGYVELTSHEDAEAVVEELKEVNGAEVVAKLAEGEEETQYYLGKMRRAGGQGNKYHRRKRRR